MIGVITITVYHYIFVSVLTVLFFSVLIYAAKHESYSFKSVKAGNDGNIEARLRLMMRKNPNSEIVVINNSAILETAEILEKMQNDFPKIHIVSY